MGRRTKKDYMRYGTFAELMKAAEQALAYERGARDGYKVAQVESPVTPKKALIGEVVSSKNNSSSRRNLKNAASR